MNHHTRSIFCARVALGAFLLGLWAGSSWADEPRAAGKTLTFTTKSAEARDHVIQVVRGIESFKPGAELQALARKAIEADPSFAFGHYLLGAVTFPPPQGQPHVDKAVELAKTASEGERAYLEAATFVRSQKPDKALEVLDALVKQYPQDRMIHMLRGQVLNNQRKHDDAIAAFETALALDASTPRVHVMLGNVYSLKGDYARARKRYEDAVAKKVAGTAPGQMYFGLALTHVYEGRTEPALKTLQGFLDAYGQSPNPGLPPVFIYNAMARIHLENGRPAEAIKLYEKGYETVPGSSLSEEDKKIWLGRLHHGKGRSLARLGRYDEAWQEAETIKKMIDEGGERGKQFVASYHYLAGYVKLEKGAHAEAIEHLKQADQEDPFIQLLLARAYEKAGDAASARAAYEKVVASNQNNLDKALALAEARKRVKA